MKIKLIKRICVTNRNKKQNADLERRQRQETKERKKKAERKTGDGKKSRTEENNVTGEKD